MTEAVLGIGWAGPTVCLHDEGEENWSCKLHIGCGGIYLTGYTNIDIDGRLQLAGNWERNATKISNYYARLNGSLQDLPVRRESIVDLKADVIDLPYSPGTVDKILGVQVFEHLSPRQAHLALVNWRTILKPDGVLVLSVPHMDGTLDLFGGNSSRMIEYFAVRHLRGSRRDEYNRHRQWFNPGDLEWMLSGHGFGGLELLENFHLYPAIVVRARKET